MKKINVLFLAGDKWHPVEIIERGMAFFEEKLSGFCIDLVQTAKDILTEEMLDQYDVCVCAKSNEINSANHEPWFEEGVTEVGPAEFRTWIERGHGFLSLHAGNSFYSDWKGISAFDTPNQEYINLVGNSFDSHPPRCDVIYTPIKEHPVLQGVSSFTVRDEHYHLKDLASDSDVFLVSDSESGSTQPAGYEKRIGKGKLLVLTPGHTLAVWQNKSFQTLLINSICYLADRIG